TEDGGYAEMVYARATGLVRVPASMDPIEAAPLLCAGITTFNALRHADAPPGAVVAIQGIGGLGHLGVQQAKQLGCRTVAIPNGQAKAAVATPLGDVSWRRRLHRQRGDRPRRSAAGIGRCRGNRGDRGLRGVDVAGAGWAGF